MRKILVVDNDSVVSGSLRRWLRLEGLDVIVANDADDAMRKLEGDLEIDVALIEVNCGDGTGTDGVWLANNMRKCGFSTPIVFMSMDINPHTPKTITSLSPFMLPKPIDDINVTVAVLQAAFDAAHASAIAH